MAARRHGTVVSYDVNYRPSLWKSRGGVAAAAAVNREIVPNVDVLFGNEEDFSAGLGYPLEADENLLELDVREYERLFERVLATTAIVVCRLDASPGAHGKPATTGVPVCMTRGGFHHGPRFEGLEIFDRVGGGDSFASGLIFGLLEGLAGRSGPRLRCRARGAGHDDAGRHLHGHAR